MHNSMIRLTLIFVCLVMVVFVSVSYARAETVNPQASSPTDTPPSGSSKSTATVNLGDQDQINVRSGPGTKYDQVGVLLAGQQVPALGRSLGGDWVQIAFPAAPGGIAWVYAYLVTVNGALPIVELPPTPTPLVTPTIDPTLAAQFIVEIPPTRLPTFTPPAPLVIPTFPVDAPVQQSGGGQLVYLMVGLGIVGLLGVLLSFIRLR